MLIIVEGIDRVGKTTLCQMLSKSFGIKIFKHDSKLFKLDKMDNDNETDKAIKIYEICKLLNGNLLLDRSYWSDFVYGVIERNYCVSNALANLKKIESIYKDEAVIVYVRPVDLKLSSKLHGADLTKYNDLFESVRKLTKCKVIDCTYESLEKVIVELESIFGDKNERLNI